MSRAIKADYRQMDLLPRSREDWVGDEHPARFIRDFVDAQDLKALGFHMGAAGKDGRPHYAADLLLKAWLYGYWLKIHSSRMLEQHCMDSMGLNWLLGGHKPDHNTLWRFWKRNYTVIRKLFNKSAKIGLKVDALSMMLHALDGTKIEAAVSTDRMWRKDDLEKYEQLLEGYLDKTEEEIRRAQEEEQGSFRLPEKLADRKKLKKKIREALEELEAEEREKMHPADKQARIMKTQGGKRLAYNAQAVVDEKKGMIVAAEVVTDTNDTQQLTPMLEQVEENLDQVGQETVVDKGYTNYKELKKAEDQKYSVLMPLYKGQGKDAGPYHISRFRYDPEQDVAICPRDQILQREGESIKRGIEYRIYRCTSFSDCPVAAECSQDPRGRKVQLSEAFSAIQSQRVRQRDPDCQRKFKRRKAIVERAFAEIKQHMGFRRWSLYGLKKAQAQWHMVCLVYNLRRLYKCWKADPQLLVGL